jgi:hypothetical protein
MMHGMTMDQVPKTSVVPCGIIGRIAIKQEIKVEKALWCFFRFFWACLLGDAQSQFGQL